MERLRNYLLFLILIDSALAVIALLLKQPTDLPDLPDDTMILSLCFSFICSATVLIFLRGQTREPGSATMHTLVSVSLKLLLDMILALVWFIIFKKSSLPSVFVFFVIYLTLSIFTVLFILKVLKNKTL
jgi:hypothetical protein